MNRVSFNNFLLRCSGASLDILEECPRSEHIKHAGIGATILLTAVLALFSGSYALYTIFGSLLVAILFGIVWSLIIFNLDRLIVSSMRKTGSWYKQLFAATPRLLLALLIAIVISKPIEIRLLETKINKVLFETNNDKVENLTTQCQEVRDQYDQLIKEKRQEIDDKEAARPPLMVTLEEEVESKKEERKNLEAQIRKRTQKYYDQINRLKREISELESEAKREGINNRSAIISRQNSISGANSRISYHQRPLDEIDKSIKELEENIDEQFQTYLLELEALRNANNASIASLQIERDNELASCEATKDKGKDIYNTNSLPDLIVALGIATDEDHVMSRISLFIMLLFIMLETAPVFVKLLAPRGPYDEMLLTREHKHRVDAEEDIIRREEDLKKQIEMFKSIDQTEMDQEIQNNKRVLKTISDAHHELIQEQVNIWLEEEKRKLHLNGNGVSNKHSDS